MKTKKNSKKFKKRIIENNSVKYSLLVAIIIPLICLIIIISHNYNSLYKVNVKYRTYTKEKGWSRWSKNGEVSGNGKDEILNIEVRVKTKARTKGGVRYYVYQNKKWTSSEKLKNKTVYGFKAHLFDEIAYEYDIYYRTYNKKDKWFDWSNNSTISGNKNIPITKIQIKTINTNLSLEDRLEDYHFKGTRSVDFEKAGDIDE